MISVHKKWKFSIFPFFTRGIGVIIAKATSGKNWRNKYAKSRNDLLQSLTSPLCASL